MPSTHDELAVPCLEALVAGTFALMTCWAAPAAQAATSPARQRLLMARKIVSNLFFLKTHPHASPALRQVMANAHERWVAVCNAVGHDRTPVMATELCAAMPPEAASLLH